MARLTGEDSYTIDVPGFARVTFRRGEHVKKQWYQHVPDEDKHLFDEELFDKEPEEAESSDTQQRDREITSEQETGEPGEDREDTSPGHDYLGT